MKNLTHKITGTGPALVFLHGFCETKEIWNVCHAKLSDKYTIISLDLCADIPIESIEKPSMESMAESVHSTALALGIDSYLLVGHSMGGYVALALAQKYPAVISGLCMFHSTAYADSEEKKMQRSKTIAYLHEHGVEAFIRPFVPQLFYPQNRKKCELAIAQLIEMGCKVPLPVIAACAVAMRDRPNRTEVLVQAAYPVLFIIGKNDGAVKPEDALAQAQLPAESYVQLLSETAHQGIFEKKTETISMLRAFGDVVYR